MLYEGTLLTLLTRAIDVPASSRSAALAAALGRADGGLFDALTARADDFNVAIVLRALQLLDAPRQLRRAEAKLAKAEAAQHSRLTALADTAGIRYDAADTAMCELLRKVDRALGTGVHKHVKRMRTVETLRQLSATEREAAQRKSARSGKASQMRAELNKLHVSQPPAADASPMRAAVSTQPEAQTASKPLPLDPARRKRLAGAVSRARQAQNALSHLHSQVNTLRATLADAGLDAQSDAQARYHISLTGAAAKRVRGWLRRIPRATLESFIVMDQPREPWRKLADIVHPSATDFALPSFLPWAFANTDKQLVAIDCPVVKRHLRVRAALASEAAATKALAQGVAIDFSLLRRRLPHLQLEGAALDALLHGPGVTAQQLLWFYGEGGLAGPHVLAAIAERLRAGEPLQFTFGKLVERMLVLRKDASQMQAPRERLNHSKGTEGDGSARGEVLAALEERAETALAAVCLDLPAPVLVLRDASASMQVCIETSAIVGCMLAVAAKADVMLFAHEATAVETPTSVRAALDMALEVQARGETLPSSAMRTVYASGTRYGSILVITDEGENGWSCMCASDAVAAPEGAQLRRPPVGDCFAPAQEQEGTSTEPVQLPADMAWEDFASIFARYGRIQVFGRVLPARRRVDPTCKVCTL